MAVEDILYENLEVIGFFGQMGERIVPQVLPPILGVKDSDVVIVPPYDRRDDSVYSTEQLTREEFLWLGQNGRATVIEPPYPYAKNIILYADEGAGPVECVTTAQALDRIITFSAKYRELGEKCYSEGNHKAAFIAFSHVSSASQEAKDYARLLLFDISLGCRNRYRNWIEKQGEDPDKLVAEIEATLGKTD